jgi:hypothetical protein
MAYFKVKGMGRFFDGDAKIPVLGKPGVPPLGPVPCNLAFASTAKRARELPPARNGFS